MNLYQSILQRFRCRNNCNDDTIDVMYGTGIRKVDAINASGAEESLLALSYCYSLNKLKNFNLLLMDEVDSSFTQDASMELANMIQKIKDEYDFIGIISHVDVVKDYYEMNGANMVNIDEVKKMKIEESRNEKVIIDRKRLEQLEEFEK